MHNFNNLIHIFVGSWVLLPRDLPYCLRGYGCHPPLVLGADHCREFPVWPGCGSSCDRRRGKWSQSSVPSTFLCRRAPNWPFPWSQAQKRAARCRGRHLARRASRGQRRGWLLCDGHTPPSACHQPHVFRFSPCCGRCRKPGKRWNGHLCQPTLAQNFGE